MSFSGGVYTLPGPALVTGEVVSATENNQFRNDVATAFNLTFLRNGTATATANLPMGGYKLTGLGVATTSGDALSYGQAATVSSLTTSSITDSGNLTFTGTGNRITGDFSNATLSNRVWAQTSTTNGASVFGVLPNGTSQLAYSLVANNSDPTNASNMFIGVTQTQSLISAGASGSGAFFPMCFYTSGVEKMRLDTSGNLGIGVTPSAWGSSGNLDLGSSASVNSSNTVINIGANWYYNSGYKYKGTGAATQYQQYSGSHTWYIAPSGTAGNAISFTQAMTLDASGNLGIGTSSPASYGKLCAFTANGDATDMLYLQRASSGTLRVRSPSGGVVLVGSPFADAVGFETNATERMRIDSSGNLLVGTTSASQSNSNSVYFYPSLGVGVYQHLNGTASGNPYCNFIYNGTQIGSITQNGTTAVAYNTSSDYRLKENIQPMQNALGVVAQLNPVTYTWKADGSDGQGFIAHELQAVVPDCVTGEKDGTRIEEYEITPAVPAVYEEVVIPAVLDEEGNVIAAEMIDRQLVTAEVPAVMGEREVPVYQGIDTSFLVATLTKAIQELKAELDATRAEVAALKNTAA